MRCACASSRVAVWPSGAAPHGLYDHDLATYGEGDTFRAADSEGFVRLWGLSAETWSRRQGPGAR